MITKRKGKIGNTEINTRIYPDRYYQKGGYNRIKLCDTIPAFEHFCEEVYKNGLKNGNEDVYKLSNYYLIIDNYNELYNTLKINNINLGHFDKYVLLFILDYMKKNLEEMSLVICEIYNLFQNDELNVLKKIMFQDSILSSVGVAKKLYDEYPFFSQFNALDDRYSNEFIKNIENYLFLLLYILKDSSKALKTLEEFRKEQVIYIDKVIDNLSVLYNLPIKNIFLNVQKKFLGRSSFYLTYQPIGKKIDDGLRYVFYKEENIYSDGIMMKSWLLDDYVDFRFDFYNFVMKGTRKIGRYKDLEVNDENKDNFDEKEWNIYIKNLVFDNSKLPSLADLEITKSPHNLYSILIYNKELEELKELGDLCSSLQKIMDEKIEKLCELCPEKISEQSLGEILDGINHGNKVLKLSIKGAFKKGLRGK